MQIKFSIDTQYGVYTDALNLADDHTYSEAEINAMKQERVNNWIAILEAPPTEEVIIETPTEEIVE